ncbi:MAG: hypothetical protein ACRD2I_18495, partial [Vicinamibacterales bacterium]
FGTAAFLTWPIWIGPLVLTLAIIVLTRRELLFSQRLNHLAVALLPIAIVAAVYTSARQIYGLRMVNAVGFALWPDVATIGWPFIILAAAGLA